MVKKLATLVVIVLAVMISFSLRNVTTERPSRLSAPAIHVTFVPFEACHIWVVGVTPDGRVFALTTHAPKQNDVGVYAINFPSKTDSGLLWAGNWEKLDTIPKDSYSDLNVTVSDMSATIKVANTFVEWYDYQGGTWTNSPRIPCAGSE